ncbi:uncharacterized protein [Amphiura filiformis]|uniref:uncharacterized protein n=1 Tax=Amphiura filiformis TaxID=82378 RepID=UPI003B211D78
MCAATRFPEAIPLRNIRAQTIVKALVKFFTLVGLPQTIQSDQGSNFTSGLFKQILKELGIEQNLATAYHAQSQGALERFHQTLKNMAKCYCLENEKDWDEGIHLLLFAVRDSVQETLGFTPFELVFGHSVRGPLKLLKEKWLGEDMDVNLLDYVSKFKTRLKGASEMAKQNLKQGQQRMKVWYDKHAKSRQFDPGDKVLVLFPVLGNPLQARFSGPYVVKTREGDLNYIVKTPDRRKKTQLCHVNMLKKFVEREESPNCNPVCVAVNSDTRETINSESEIAHNSTVQSLHTGTCSQPPDVELNDYNVKLKNSDVLANIDDKVSHLPPDHQEQIKALIQRDESLFPDTPSVTCAAMHDIDVSDTPPIKQHPYRLNPQKMKCLKQEIDYMLENGIIEPSKSEWSSPCIMVPKPDGSFRVVADMRQVNKCSKTDSYPIPRIDDCIDRVGNAKYVSKFDLLKRYWQVPLTDRAKEISAFCTPFSLYQYRVMPFGLKNAPATFQRMVNNLVSDIDNCEAYVDDLIIHTETWPEHLAALDMLFRRLSEANLTINLLKSEFCHATVKYLGHEVGMGKVRPLQAKVEAIEKYPHQKGRKT